MAAHPVVVVDDELLKKLPVQLQGDPRYQCGARLELVPVVPPEAQPSPDEILATWKSLQGILEHSSYDPNAELEKEKQRELADEARWRS
jgi:hypothetical protein